MKERKKCNWQLIAILVLVALLLVGAGGAVIWIGFGVQYRDYSGEEYGVERYYSMGYPGFLRSKLDVPDTHKGLPVLAVGAVSGPGNGGNLKKLTVAEGVKSINRDGFRGCEKLAEIVLPDSIRDIGTNAFEGTAYYNNSANWKGGALYIGNHLIKVKETVEGVFKVKEGTVSIADEAFTGSKISGVELPSGLKRISPDAFVGCSDLKFYVKSVQDWAVIDKSYYDSSVKKRTRAFKEKYELYIDGKLLRSVNLNENFFSKENTSEPRFVYANCTNISAITLEDDWAKWVKELNEILRLNSSIEDVYFPCSKEEFKEQPETLNVAGFNIHFRGEDFS